MAGIKTRADIQSAIQPLGFKLTINSSGGHKIAAYQAIDPSMEKEVHLADRQRYWQPLFDWRRQNKLSLVAIKKETGIIGLL